MGIVGAALALVLLIPFLVLDKEHAALDAAARSALPGQYISLQQGEVRYELEGPAKGPLVVLVHGFSVPSHIWDPTFEALTGAGFRVLRYDLFGRGFSDRPDVVYDLDLFVSQLDQLVGALKIDAPFHIVGLSMGGPIAAAFANRFPARVRTVTLIDPLTEALTLQEVFPTNVPLIGEYVMAVYAIPFLFPASQKKDFYRPERFPDWVARYQVQMRYKGYRRAILSTLRNLMRDVDPLVEYRALGRAGRRVLLFRGAADRTITQENIDAIQSAIPGVRFHEIKEAGHVPHYEQAAVVNPIIIGFLREDASR